MVWIWAVIAIIGAFVLGSIASRIVRSAMSQQRTLAQFASAGASSTFSIILVIGLLIALGFVQPAALEQLRDDTINYLPRALSALIVVIMGGVLGTIVSTAVRESVGRSMGRMGEKVPSVVKGLISAFAAILAASQLGIDTTVINIVVAAAVFGMAGAFALVVGFGSRPVAAEIARGRALQRVVQPGDTVSSSTMSGEVILLHPTAIELDIDGVRTMVPNSSFTESHFAIDRSSEE